MEIVDAQIHEPLPHSGLAEDAIERRRQTLDLALAQMDAAGVDAAVVSTHDLGWTEYAFTASGGRITAMPSGLAMDGPDVEERLARWMVRPGVLGVRVLLLAPTPFWKMEVDTLARFREGAFDRFFAMCEAEGIPLMIGSFPGVEAIDEVASRFRRLTLIVDHLGLTQPPVPRDGGAFDGLPTVVALASHPRVALKLTGAPTLSAEAYPFRDIWQPLRELLAAFGPERLCWGSDFQRVTGRMANYANDGFGVEGRHSYAEAVGYLRFTDLLSDAEKALIMGGNLRRLLRWQRG